MEALGISESLNYISKFYSISNIFDGKQLKPKNSIPPYLSTALGTITVSPLQAAKAFAIFCKQREKKFILL